jgi:asparagine synthase (glutamine-hydrolysing)
MCAITGLLSFTGEIDLDGYYDAHSLLAHRGPDDEGFTVKRFQDSSFIPCRGDDTIPALSGLGHIKEVKSAQVVLGQRRLSIIDLSAAGHQPFLDDTGKVSLVFNGEIFNYIEIRDELKKSGVVIRNESDTEIVLQTYLAYGIEGFSKFNGMWAVAIYDSRDAKLILSRDRFGIKPLYWSRTGDVVSFASEMQFIRKFSRKELTPNAEYIKGYLNSCDLNSGSATIWENISEINPGTTVVLDAAGERVHDYWPFRPTLGNSSYDDAVCEFADLFEDSLRLRMRSDVEVGSLLSGGLDSNTIVFGLNKIGKISGNDFHVFSAVFKEEEWSEKKYIDETLKKLPMKSHFVYPRPETFLRDMPALIRSIEVPFRSMSVYSQYLIYSIVRGQTNVKVLLNGQGADEMFAGYSGHYRMGIADSLARLDFGSVGRIYSGMKQHRGANPRLFISRSLLRNTFHAIGKKNYANDLLFNEIKKNSLREYLHYDDRNSMAFGLEARVPFLDHRLVEFAYSIPFNYKIRGFTNKAVQRDYARKMVPGQIVNRTDKMGFVSPQSIWQRNELKPAFDATYARIGKEGFATVDCGKRLANSYESYCRGKDYEDLIWRGFCLKMWEDEMLCARGNR